jgi:hypothetical protein
MLYLISELRWFIVGAVMIGFLTGFLARKAR